MTPKNDVAAVEPAKENNDEAPVAAVNGNRKLAEAGSLEFINFVNFVMPYMKIQKGNETKFIAEAADIGM